MTQHQEAIADAQAAFAERLTARGENRNKAGMILGLQPDASLYSPTSDGSIFSVSVQYTSQRRLTILQAAQILMLRWDRAITGK